MNLSIFRRIAISSGYLLLFPLLINGQGTLADYERAQGLRTRFQGLAIHVPGRARWIERTSRFWYTRSVKGGSEFIMVDAPSLVKKPAFDHEKLAASLSAAAEEKYNALELPFTNLTGRTCITDSNSPCSLTFIDNDRAIQFTAGDSNWRCDLTSYSCTKLGPAERRGTGGLPQLRGPQTRPPDQPRPSPDKAWEAFVKNYNVYVRSSDKKQEFALSFDGSEGNFYSHASLAWSPDSQKLAAYRVRPGYHRKIQYVESSPADQLQPRYSSLEYAKPGDTVDIEQPVLFLLSQRKQIDIDNQLFPNPYDMSNLVWRKDSGSFTFEYNQRGHQVYRVIEVEADTGKPRALIDESSKTFFCYSGKKYRHDVQDGKEMIWMSERDGWNHLYRFDGTSGKVINQITNGQWVVRGVEKVDDDKRQIWFRASGMYPGKDPYFNHYYRINFDGSGLTALTEADANHVVSFSPDMKYYVDTWSRIDQPAVSQLRSSENGTVLQELERADIRQLVEAGWRAPEAFISKARDGKTEIWGIIIRPTNFDPAKKYPVIESIYAGPQDSFVPKSFSPYYAMQAQAELGFIVVQIDGMGTSNRSKAFHDVAWKNLADAGFPDRILWHRAVAAKYPYYDISRVGIYGHSAGGQNALGALLFYPEFYKACVSSCGCHDNRMDKIWWNEQWMGWPLGTEYAASSNVENAHRLRGNLLLSVGEMDPNVDPASTLQVANALIKANKTFDLIVLPGQGHSQGGEYGERKRFDFFVHHLLGVEPPDWNKIELKKDSNQTSSSSVPPTE
jgi:dipeptidyl aminopeptidase/acylaminoacyl peptidase